MQSSFMETVVAEVRGWNPSEFKDDKFPTEKHQGTQFSWSFSFSLEQNSACCEIRLCFISFKKDLHILQLLYFTWAGYLRGVQWDYSPAVELVCPANTLLCSLAGDSGHWSLLLLNLLIDFHCCVAWRRSRGHPLAWHARSDCSPKALGVESIIINAPVFSC